MMVVLIKFIIKATDNRTRRRMYHILYCAFMSISGFIIFLTGMSKGYDTTALAYMICTVIIYFSISRYDLIHAMDAAKEYVLDNLKSALIGLDDDKRIVYFNKQNFWIYPDLMENELKIYEELNDLCENSSLKICENTVY